MRYVIAFAMLAACASHAGVFDGSDTTSNSDAGVGVTVANASSSTAGAGGSGSAGSNASSASTSASSTAAGSPTAASSTVAASSSSGPPPAECDGKAKGTVCYSTCICKPCGMSADPNSCTHGLCDAGTCQPWIQVKCKVNGTTYVGCVGDVNGPDIVWDGANSKCLGGSGVGYCAPGKQCFVTVGGNLKGQGVCL